MILTTSRCESECGRDDLLSHDGRSNRGYSAKQTFTEEIEGRDAPPVVNLVIR
jgi:hypothetical protein